MRDPSAQLELLARQADRFAPALYRDLALYLQVLRQHLLPASREAVLQLITRTAPETYANRPPAVRQAFQDALVRAVQRCTSLLTVEQLVSLARAMERDSAGPRAVVPGRARVQGTAPEHLPVDGSGADAPPGSVTLSMRSPVGQPGKPGVPDDAPQDPEAAGPSEEARDRPLMEALFQLVSEGMPDALPARSGASPRPADSGPPPGGQATRPAVPAQGLSRAIPPWREPDRLVPRQPERLQAWWDHLDLALTRRLRNLSHVINSELLRGRFNSTLLPQGLLQAVLDGHLDSLPAPPNVLAVLVPMPTAGGPGLRQSMALLLRSGDLEEAHPRLRQCRRRLDLRRRELRRMVQQHRYWTRRAHTLEAERAWRQDTTQRAATGSWTGGPD